MDRRSYYVDYRLSDQAEWYRRKGVASTRSGVRWFWLTVLFQIAAAAMAVAALAGAGDSVLRIVALLGSIALAITAWPAAQPLRRTVTFVHGRVP